MSVVLWFAITHAVIPHKQNQMSEIKFLGERREISILYN